jgi:hypothetical protein
MNKFILEKEAKDERHSLELSELTGLRGTHWRDEFHESPSNYSALS